MAHEQLFEVHRITVGDLQAMRDKSAVLTLERHTTVSEKVCIMRVCMYICRFVCMYVCVCMCVGSDRPIGTGPRCSRWNGIGLWQKKYVLCMYICRFVGL